MDEADPNAAGADAPLGLYFVTGVAPSGGRRTCKVMATSVRDAVAKLEAQGYTDVRSDSDESMAFGAAISDDPSAGVDEDFTAEEQLHMAKLTRWGNFVFVCGKFYAAFVWPIVIAVGLAAWDHSDGDSSTWGDAFAVIVVALPALLAAWASFFGPAVELDRMLESFSWGRWESVIRQAEALRDKVPGFEVDGRIATALGGLGRVEEGLKLIRPYESDPEVPGWAYWNRIAEIHEVAGDEEAVLESHHRALAEGKDVPTVALDVALATLRAGGDPDMAATLIEAVKSEPPAGPMAMFLPLLEGLLAHRRGQYAEAAEFYAAEQQALQPMMHQPLVRLFRDEVSARQAVVHAKLGELDQARELWRKAEPRMRALKSKRLIAEVEDALGVA